MSEVLEEILPEAVILLFAKELGVVQRERKRQVVALVRATVVAAGTPSGGVQADALRAYLEYEVPHVSRQAFYRWFAPPLERLMERLAERALCYARRQQLDVPTALDIATDWRIVDSETVKVRDAMIDQFPGTGEYAAIKVHKTLSVGSGAPVDYHFSRARDHDSLHLTIDESWRGYGLLADLAYVSIARLAACQKHGVHFVVRLKQNWQPRVERITRGEVTRTFLAGSDLDALLADRVLLLDGKVIDAQVRVGRKRKTLDLRLVGIPTPKGYCFFLTNLPPRIGPRQVGDIYRVRWGIELSNKLDKSVHRLDESEAERPCSIKALLHASLIASVISAVLAHKHNLATRPAEPGAPRTEPPVHTMLLARALCSAAMRIADAFELDGEQAEAAWTRIAAKLTHLGKDPNWRHRPSVLDQMRGWRIQPRARHASPQAGRARRQTSEG